MYEPEAQGPAWTIECFLQSRQLLYTPVALCVNACRVLCSPLE